MRFYYHKNLVLISTLFAARDANLSFVDMDPALMCDFISFISVNEYQLRDMERFDNYLKCEIKDICF